MVQVEKGLRHLGGHVQLTRAPVAGFIRGSACETGAVVAEGMTAGASAVVIKAGHREEAPGVHVPAPIIRMLTRPGRPGPVPGGLSGSR